MKLTGLLLWIAGSAIATTIADVFFRLPIFRKKTEWISYAKFVIVLFIAESISIAYCKINNVYGILGYFGIYIYQMEDAIYSGILMAGGASTIYEIEKTIKQYKEYLETKTELLTKAKRKISPDDTTSDS